MSWPQETPAETCDWPECWREALYSEQYDGGAVGWWCYVHRKVKSHQEREVEKP